MDPNACLDQLVQALNAGDFPAGNKAMGDLLIWILAGGKVPEADPGQLWALRRHIPNMTYRLEDAERW